MAKKILVVDDSPTELKLVVAKLQSTGYQIVTAANGEEAMQKATAEQPCLIVLDVVMPGKNGFQVCRSLKTNPATQSIKILMLTSKSGESDKFWGIKQGADGYLTKPFDESALLTEVARLA